MTKKSGKNIKKISVKSILPRVRFHSSSPELDGLVDELLSVSGPKRDDSFLREMLITILRIREDELETADVKLMNTTLKELWYSFKVFQPYRHVRKVAVFGSARTPHTDPAYLQAKNFAHEIVKHGWMVITGASSGIMSAGNEGAGREKSFGVNIRLPFEQGANPVIEGDRKLINYKYFFTRKLMFVRESDATCLCPGGFGTHDEGFETLTLVQTGKATPRPIICLDPPGSTYWKDWRGYIEKQLGKGKMIDPNDLDLVHFTHDAAEAARVIAKFYSHYHSLRYIQDLLVMRIKKPLSRKLLTAINREFADIVVKGTIRQQRKPFEQEELERHTHHLTRLFFYFDRRHHVRVKQLVDWINSHA